MVHFLSQMRQKKVDLEMVGLELFFVLNGMDKMLPSNIFLWSEYLKKVILEKLI